MNFSLPRLLIVGTCVVGNFHSAWAQALIEGDDVTTEQVINGQVINVGVNPSSATFNIATTSNQRIEREKLASSVMSPEPNAAVSRAEQALDLAAFNETAKRLQEVEVSDPNRALREYRRFLTKHDLSPGLGVQLALKVAQMRQKLNDFQGALLTCDVMAKKYTAEPSSALLLLQKGRVLMSQKKLVQASQCVDEAMPELMALGTQHYAEASEFLLQLAQRNLVGGEGEGKARAAELYADVEQIYLRWIKKDTVDHLWQRFKALQADYQQAGDEKGANELLPKVADLLLQIPPKPDTIEGAVLSLEAARWFSQQGENEQASVFYKRIPEFHDRWHTFLALYDQCNFLLSSEHIDDAQSLLDQWKKKYSSDLFPYGVSLMEGNISMRRGQWSYAHSAYSRAAKEFGDLNQNNTGDRVILGFITDGVEWSKTWMERSFVCNSPDMTTVVQRLDDKTARQSWDVRVDSPRSASFKAECPDARVQLTVNDATKNTFGYQATISIDVHLKSSEDYVETEVRIFPADHPDQVVKLPLFIEVQ
jgi:tetratricopeptide (TPR) repeat protein